jgi:hypothetical protein
MPTVTETIMALLSNPAFLFAVLAIVRNIGGYIYSSLEAKRFIPYDGYKLLETLALWETVLLLLTAADLPVKYSVAIATVLDFVRSLTKVVKQYLETRTPVQTLTESPRPG